MNTQQHTALPTQNIPSLLKRGSGILLHISSLPSNFGIGDFGPAAYEFVDELVKAGQVYWQLLPLNPTETVYGNSPYSSQSAFALNAIFISPDFLLQEGWLHSKDLQPVAEFSDERVDYEKVVEYKARILDTVYQKFSCKKIKQREFAAFCAENDFWLEDYALFRVLKKYHGGQQWNQWPEKLRKRDPKDISRFSKEHNAEIEKIKLLQFIAYQQWGKIKDYGRKKGVYVVGDIPIYVNYDGADVWSHPEIFKLNSDGSAAFVAGVPPDYFSKTGQRWGNPVYDWNVLKETEYDWWIKRIRHNLKGFDFVRIDHFRGLIAYWQIPSQEKTAVNGEWVEGPGDDFFNKLREKISYLPIIAEDLGLITPEVTAAMERFHFPGMKIFMFAFGEDIKTHPYIPNNYTENYVAYTGTHDNNTVVGWHQNDIAPKEKENLRLYFGKDIAKDHIHWDMIQALMDSKANVVILPLQDVLGLGQDARMNTPATSKGNWEWRFKKETLTSEISAKLYQMTLAAQRRVKV